LKAWRAVLVGEPAERARRFVDEIAAELAALEPTTPGLVDGAAGLAVFFAYYGDVTGDERAYDRAVAMIERASTMIAQTQVGFSWSSGLAGIAWVIDHLHGDTEDDPNIGVDRLFEEMLASPWEGNYDLISGLAGFAVYGLARLPRESARRMLAQVVAQLERTVEARGHERTWHTPASQLPAWQEEIAPNGYYNLGLAHGVPALIAVLGEVAAAGIEADRVRTLLDGAVAWQLGRRCIHPLGSFGAWTRDGNDRPLPSRTAWCYGDAGVASAMAIAGRALDEHRWQHVAHELARDVARRAATLELRDVGLCHGAMGLALILDRFFHLTGDVDFENAAVTMTQRGLSMYRPSEATNGHAAHEPRDEPNAGLLTGAAGIGLAMLAMASDVEPAWDRVMLLPR
jgi:lantibiotic biosynthesis protein